MTQPTLDEFCSPPKKQPRKEYVHCLPPVTCSEHREVLLINLEHLANAMRGDCVWASLEHERSPETFKLIKYQRALVAVQSGEPIHMPWLAFSEGRTRLVDGRHRLYALLNEGDAHVRVVVDPPTVEPIGTLVDEENVRPATTL